MVVHSAGILPYRLRADGAVVLVGHMGGPYWARKDEAAWSVVKGEFDPSAEAPEDAARREFHEETGLVVDTGLTALGELRLPSGKRLHAFACEADADWELVTSNTFELEWPPRSGRVQAFPEIDRAAWLRVDAARRALVKGQRPVLDLLAAHLRGLDAADLPGPADGASGHGRSPLS